MTQEIDEKEFEEWEHINYGVVGLVDGHGIAKKAWLASRRLLREQLGKWHDVEEFYKESKNG